MEEGTQALKDVLALPMSLHMMVDLAKADGKIDANDLGLVLAPVMKVVPFIKALKDAPKQMADLSDQERKEVHAWAKAGYNIADDEVEKKVEAALGVALHIGQFLGKIL